MGFVVPLPYVVSTLNSVNCECYFLCAGQSSYGWMNDKAD